MRIEVLILSFGIKWGLKENSPRLGRWSAIFPIGANTMSINQDYRDLFRHFNDAGVRFLIVGAYAVIYHAEPRYTKDIDLWIRPDSENAQKVYAALKKFGAPLADLTVQDLSNPEMVYQIGIEPNRIDILMGIGGPSFDELWERRCTDKYGDQPITILSLEDLIQAKKIANRPEDQKDLKLLEPEKYFAAKWAKIIFEPKNPANKFGKNEKACL